MRLRRVNRWYALFIRDKPIHNLLYVVREAKNADAALDTKQTYRELSIVCMCARVFDQVNRCRKAA